MKVELKRFTLKDYVRFLKTKLSPKTRKEFSRSLVGYLISGIRSVGSKNKYHRFSVYADEKFVGFGTIYNLRGFYELGIFTLPKFRNKGIALEATKKLIEHSFEKLKFKNIKVVIDKDNPAPYKIAKKLGFKLIKKTGREIIFEKLK